MKIRISVFLIIPTVAHASGGDVLNLLWLEVGLFVVTVIFLLTSKLRKIHRFIIFLSYFISALITLGLTANLPYSDNQVFINSLNLLLPIIACTLVWWWSVKESKK